MRKKHMSLQHNVPRGCQAPQLFCDEELIRCVNEYCQMAKSVHTCVFHFGGAKRRAEKIDNSPQREAPRDF